MERQLFRTAALERLSSPEQIDQLLQVTGAKSWLALLALCALVFATLLWSFLGRLPIQATGHGVLIRGDSVKAVAAITTGQLQWVNAKVGDVLEEGQAVAAIAPLEGEALRRDEELLRIIASPQSGRVLEVVVDRGAVVGQGNTILTMEPVADTLEVVMYLPASGAMQLRPGMLAQVEPSTVSQRQFGMLQARVRSVAEFPSTYPGLMRVLQNDRLAQDFLAAGPPFEVRLELEPDTASPSGYRWSSSSGPPFTIGSGALATAVITIREQRPIGFVLPVLGD